jgi:hypothetical protein
MIGVNVVFDISGFKTLLQRCKKYEELTGEVFYLHGFLFYDDSGILSYKKVFKSIEEVLSKEDIEQKALEAMDKLNEIFNILENKNGTIQYRPGFK